MEPRWILKIDKSFVDTLAAGEQGKAVASLIVDLARTLDLDVLAEGIEEPEQATILRQLGCRLGQGYLFSRPLDARAGGLLLGCADDKPVSMVRLLPSAIASHRQPPTGFETRGVSTEA